MLTIRKRDFAFAGGVVCRSRWRTAYRRTPYGLPLLFSGDLTRREN